MIFVCEEERGNVDEMSHSMDSLKSSSPSPDEIFYQRARKKRLEQQANSSSNMSLTASSGSRIRQSRSNLNQASYINDSQDALKTRSVETQPFAVATRNESNVAK